MFSLGGWSPQLHAGLHVSRITRDTARGRTRRLTGLSPSMAGRSRPLQLGVVLPWRGPTTPRVQAPLVWAGPRSLTATKGIAVAFSSSGYLDVSVLRVRSPKGDYSSSSRVAPFRNLRITSYVPIPAAYRSLSRLSSPSRP